LWVSQKKRDRKEDLNVGGRIIIKMGLREMGYSDTDWIQVAQDRDQWLSLVNTVIKLQVP
jgi:hypothetical protein